MSKIIATDLDGTFLYPKRKFFLVDKRYKKIINRYPGEIVLLLAGVTGSVAALIDC